MFYAEEAGEIAAEFTDRCNACELWNGKCPRRRCIENMFYDDKTLRICIFECKYDTSPRPEEIEFDF